MPNMTPKAEMDAETSIPPWTSFWGIKMAQTDPIRFPNREVAAMGSAMRAMRWFRRPDASPAPSGPSIPRRQRRCRRVRAQEENTSQITMPVTMSPTVRSGFWGRKSTSSPSTAPVRMNCSHSSTAAGGRMLPVPVAPAAR